MTYSKVTEFIIHPAAGSAVDVFSEFAINSEFWKAEFPSAPKS